MFERFFKPKWQHSQASVRIAAVGALDDADAKHYGILKQLALMDDDAGVRVAATTRIADPARLLALLAEVEEEQRARDLLQHVWDRVASHTNASVLFENMPAAQRLRYALLSSAAPMAELLVATLTDDAHLAAIVEQAPFASVRLRAAQSIDNEEVLERLAALVRTRDKGAYRVIRDKIDELRRQRDSVEGDRQAIIDALEALQAHARMPVEPLHASRTDHLYKQWQRFSAQASQEQCEAAAQALAQCRDKGVPEPVVPVSSPEAESTEEAARERAAALFQLEQAWAAFVAGSEIDTADLPALSGLLTTQRNRWNEACATAEPEADERRRFKQVYTLLEQVRDAGQVLLGRAPAITDAATRLLDAETRNPADLASLRKALERAAEGVRWPDALSRPQVIDLMQRAYAHHDARAVLIAQEEERAVAVIDAALTRLAGEIERGNLKAAQSLLRDQQVAIKSLPMRRAEPLQRQLREHTRKLNELRDWQGFATLPKKQALCDEMESLVGLAIDPELLAGRIRRLQEQWKLLGHVDVEQSQALWERFSAAGDKAWEPCRDYFATLAEVRRNNLAAREELCRQLQEYLTAVDWNSVDWRAARDILDTARQEWRRYAPVERKQGDIVQQQFNVHLKTLQDRIQAEFDRNLGRRRGIIAEAEALLASSDLASAIERAKQLQRDWKDTGMVPQREDSALWKQFRAACDALFARRDEVRSAGQARRDQALAEAEALCAEIESLITANESGVSVVQARARELQAAFDAIDGLPRERVDDLRRRFRAANEALRHAVREENTRKRNEAAAEVWNLLAAVDAAEASVIAGREPAPLPPLSAVGDPGLRDALSQRLARIVAPIEDDVLVANTAALRDLCLRVEILADLESPAAEQQRRMELQIQRFNKGDVHKEAGLSLAERVLRLQREWAAIGPVMESDRTALTVRFRAAVDAAMKE